jgi:hypothetical protein
LDHRRSLIVKCDRRFIARFWEIAAAEDQRGGSCGGSHYRSGKTAAPDLARCEKRVEQNKNKCGKQEPLELQREIVSACNRSRLSSETRELLTDSSGTIRNCRLDERALRSLRGSSQHVRRVPRYDDLSVLIALLGDRSILHYGNRRPSRSSEADGDQSHSGIGNLLCSIFYRLLLLETFPIAHQEQSRGRILISMS